MVQASAVQHPDASVLLYVAGKYHKLGDAV
jgi:hypothetical protein